MIIMWLLLLLLPAVALASMEVRIGGMMLFDSAYILQGDIHTEGSEQRAITDNDRVAFRIPDEGLKSAIESYYGKRPDQVFLTPDTPWGDLHKKLGLKPVEVKIEPDTEVYVSEFESKKVVLSSTVYQNEHTETMKKRILESGTTHNTVASLWNNPSKFSANNVGVKFILNLDVGNDVESVDHTFSFGISRKIVPKKNRNQSRLVDLAPGQKVRAELEVKKKTLKFEIIYKVSLTGGVTVNYNEKYKNSHFHGWDINRVLGNRTMLVAQTILYDFYYGQNLNILDAEDRYTVLQSFPEDVETGSSHKRRASAAKHASGDKIARKAPRMPIDFTEEDLKSIVEDVFENEDNEESDETSEQKTTEKPQKKTPLAVKPE